MLILWFRVYEPDSTIIQYKHLNRIYFDCKTKLCLIVPGKLGKYIGLHKKVSIYKVSSMKSINRTHLLMTVNTSK